MYITFYQSSSNYGGSYMGLKFCLPLGEKNFYIRVFENKMLWRIF
jgi:hypothetical protein